MQPAYAAAAPAAGKVTFWSDDFMLTLKTLLINSEQIYNISKSFIVILQQFPIRTRNDRSTGYQPPYPSQPAYAPQAQYPQAPVGPPQPTVCPIAQPSPVATAPPAYPPQQPYHQ